MGSPPKNNTDLVSSPQLHFNFYFYAQEEKDRFFFFVVVLIICNFFRTRKAIYKAQNEIEISSQLGSIQGFCKFVDSFHLITKCTEPNCPVGNLGSKLKKCLMKI